MRRHEEFESMCALALLGELPADEQKELIAHMRTCEACCRSAHEFVDVMQHMPLEHSELSNSEIRDMEEGARTRDFLSRARKEGVVFSRDALRQPDTRQPVARRFVSSPPYAIPAAVALILVVGFSPHFLMQRAGHNFSQPSRSATVQQSSALPSGTVLEEEDRSHELQVQLAQTQDELAAAQEHLSEVEQKLDGSEKDKAAATAEVQRLSAALSNLQAEYQKQQQQLAQSNSEILKVSVDRDQAVASVVADESRLRDYEVELVKLRSGIEQERELNAAAHDVREMMGARNLHIIDVYDSDNPFRRSDRSFGRVIYIEGKSLIFYAFDLDKVHNAKKVSFQAWGEREGEHRDPKKLGVFYIDDVAQKRWVLKVSDPEKLKSIDTVFVTVENHEDVRAPNHQRLLQAYLGSKANHP